MGLTGFNKARRDAALAAQKKGCKDEALASDQETGPDGLPVDSSEPEGELNAEPAPTGKKKK